MERLTYYSMKGSENDGWYLKPGVSREQGIDRLAAYEDTGLEPEEIKELALKVATLETIEAMYEGLGRPDHLRSLVEAEAALEGGKDG